MFGFIALLLGGVWIFGWTFLLVVFGLFCCVLVSKVI